MNGVVSKLNSRLSETQHNVPIKIGSTNGAIAFGDVRVKQHSDETIPSSWSSFEYEVGSLETTGDVSWSKTDAGDLAVEGTGTVIIPNNASFHSIRFDAKFSGDGTATVQFGEFELDFGTAGERKTGGITSHPIRTNFIDQHEWCLIEIQQNESTRVFLNGIEIIVAQDAPPMSGNDIRILVDNATLLLRRTLTQD